MPASPDTPRRERYEAATARSLTVLSLLVVPVYVAQALTAGRSGPAVVALTAARVTIHVALGADVAVRTVLAPRRLHFLATHKLDIASVMIPPLRAAREVLALRAILRRPGLVAFVAAGASLVVGCGLVVYAAEHDRQNASIETIGDALWWALVTTTTVGYGDEVPVTGEGRAMAVVLMLLGIVVLSVLTAHIAAYFVDARDDRDAPQNDVVARLDRIEESLSAIRSQFGRLDGPLRDEHTTSPVHREAR